MHRILWLVVGLWLISVTPVWAKASNYLYLLRTDWSETRWVASFMRYNLKSLPEFLMAKDVDTKYFLFRSVSKIDSDPSISIGKIVSDHRYGIRYKIRKIYRHKGGYGNFVVLEEIIGTEELGVFSVYFYESGTLYNTFNEDPDLIPELQQAASKLILDTRSAHRRRQSRMDSGKNQPPPYSETVENQLGGAQGSQSNSSLNRYSSFDTDMRTPDTDMRTPLEKWISTPIFDRRCFKRY